MTTYPHCEHCAWSNPHHVEQHATPCVLGCSGAVAQEAGLW